MMTAHLRPPPPADASAPSPRRSGWIAGIPDDVYHADRDTVSSSGLRTLDGRSPAHFRAELDNPRTETPAMVLGRAIHCRTLEPERYAKGYVVPPVCDRRTKAGKQTWDDFVQAHPGATILTAADAEIVEGVAAAVHAHPVARAALQGAEIEVSGYYVDAETGVHCRIRPDAMRRELALMIDLKSALDASPAGFRRTMHQRGYHVQAAMYAAGYRAITGEALTDYLLIAAEKSPPYAVACYRIDAAAMVEGERIYRRALRTYAACLASDRWPGYGEGVEPLGLPAWAWGADEEGEA
jgi:exodeoxyribonuclease VIII